jgi:bifunctional DNA-binding transcriptional regulator/antitoxin component of YhaV-PrlF toxin-antitoxin module
MTTMIQDTDRFYEVVVNDAGQVVIPASMIQAVGLVPGDFFRMALIEKNGEWVLKPFQPQVTQIATEIDAMMREEGVTLTDLLEGLEEIGDEVYRKYYGS